MKFGYETIRWGTSLSRPLLKVLDEISRAGYEGFEIRDNHLSPIIKNPKDFHDALLEKELTLVSIYTPGGYFRGLESLPYYLWWRWRQIGRIIKFASDVGCKLIVVGGEERNEIKEKDCIKIAKVLNKVGRTCNDFGIEASYHAIQEHLIRKICELTDPDLVHLTVDTAHLISRGTDVVKVIKNYANRINLVHFKDLKDGRFVEFGEGTIKFKTIIGSLKSIHYDRWIIIEDEINSVTRTPFESLKRTKAYIEMHLCACE